MLWTSPGSSSAIGSSRSASVRLPATRTSSPVSQMWCSTIFSSRSGPRTWSRDGSRIDPGGTKCTASASPIWMWPGFARHSRGVAS